MTRQAASQYDTRWGRWALLALALVLLAGFAGFRRPTSRI